MKRIMAALLLAAILLLPVNAAETVPETTDSTETVETMQYEPFDLPVPDGGHAVLHRIVGTVGLTITGVIAVIVVRQEKRFRKEQEKSAHE